MTINKISIFFALSGLILSVTSPLYAEPNGTWDCKLDSKEWKDAKSGASLNGGLLTLYSSDDRTDGIYIMMNKPAAVGSYALNESVQASLADAAGVNHKSKAGSGTLVISKYTPPEGEVKGKVEGTFSGNFESNTGNDSVLKDCTFSLPVKNL